MLCPECGLDYEEEVKRCTDCDVTLIAFPEDEETVDEGEFLPFIEVTDVGAFALVTSQLEQAARAAGRDRELDGGDLRGGEPFRRRPQSSRIGGPARGRRESLRARPPRNGAPPPRVGD